MIPHPFTLFRPFAEQLDIRLLTKDDGIASDEHVAAMIGTKNLVALHQVHGSRVIKVSGPIARTEKADGMITDVRNLALAIRTADCQQFVVYAPERHVVGLMHVGWKGLLAGTIPAFFALLKSEWSIGPEDVFVGAGPSLCQDCGEFTDPKKELPGIDHRFFNGRCADLGGIADAQLLEAGVPPDHIDRHPECTRCHPERYWTYRGGHRQEVLDGHTNVLTCMLL